MKSSNNNKNKKTASNDNSKLDPISLLPSYSLEIYEDDYFKELILEPLSFLTSGDIIIVSPTSPHKKEDRQQKTASPIKNDNKQQNDGDEDDDEDDQDYDDDYDEDNSNTQSSTNSQYYCPFCKKKFLTEQTWNTHINSSKHLKSIKDQKKKSTTSGGINNYNTPTKTTTPTKSVSSNNNNNNNTPTKNSNIKDNEFLQEQILQTQQAIKIKNTKPNLACKNLFTIARSYCQRQYIRDSAKTLNLLIEILSTNSNTQKEPTTPTPITLNNILNNATLLCKTHLYFGRLTRLFQQPLSEYHFIECFNNLSLISIEQLQKYESLLVVSNNSANTTTTTPLNLFKIFNNQLDKEVITENSNNNKNNINLENIEAIIKQINSYINEISGGLCYCKVNYKSIILYILASCITFKFKLYVESLESNTRAFKLLSSLKLYNWSIDILLNNLIIKLKLLQETTTTTTIETEEREYFKNIIISILKYCILIDDKIRLNDILSNSSFKLVISSYVNKEDEIINCLIESSNQFLIENYKEIDNLKDKYEHIIYSNKDIIFIFNQFDLKKRILLLK